MISLSIRKKLYIFPYVLILPTAFFVALFTAWPVLLSIYQSFFRQRMNIARFRDPTFIGLDNYVELFTDPYFLQVIRNTFVYVIGTVPISIMLGLFFALLVNRQIKGTRPGPPGVFSSHGVANGQRSDDLVVYVHA